VHEIVRMPTDLVRGSHAASLGNPLLYEMTRLRTVLYPVVSEEEVSLVRAFRVPDERSFGLFGTARLSSAAPDHLIDEVLGSPDALAGGITVRASGHLRTSASARASSAIDGDTTTTWTSDTAIDTEGQWIEVELAEPTTFDRLDLQVVADGRHSVPTKLRLDVDGVTREVDVPAVVDGAVRGVTAAASVSFEAVTGTSMRVSIVGVRAVETVDYDSGRTTALPVAVAELGIPGVQPVDAPRVIATPCRDDLVEIDGRPVSVRVTGDVDGELEIRQCEQGGSPGAIELEPGRHVVRAVPGSTTGLDVDGLVLASDAGGSALADRVEVSELLAPTAPPAPRVEVIDDGRTRIEARVRDAQEPFWLVLGQSFNRGWHAEVGGRDLGEPQLIDGLANGWRVDPQQRSFRVTFTWAPQRWVWVGIAVSALTLLACLVLALRGRSRAVESQGEEPVEGSAFDAAGVSPTRAVTVATTGATALVTAALVAPWVGVITGAAVFVVLVRGRLRWLLTLGAPLALAAVAGYVLVQQTRHSYEPGLSWPARFDDVHALGLLAVMLLAADVVVEQVRGRAARRANLPLE
jgi:hypothetical protein